MKIINSKDKIRDEYISYLSDESSLKGTCSNIFFPENIDDIKDIVRSHYSDSLPITISNGRTGITGGAVPFNTDLISIEKINTISETKENALFVGAGCSLDDIESYLMKNKKEYFYPVDVTESTARIGGTIATDASGSRSYHYGSTREWIISIKVILADGDELFIKRGDYIASGKNFKFKDYKFTLPEIKNLNVKNVAGYYIKEDMDLIDLFIGSEGTLGIIAEAEIKIIKQPDDIVSLMCFFHKEEDGINFFFNVLKELKNVSAFEFFDKNSLELLSDEFNIKVFHTAILIETVFTEDAINSISSIMKNNNSDIDNTWVGESKKEKEKIKKFRHRLPELINSMIASKKNRYPNIHKISTDIAVPMNNLKIMLEYYHEILKKENIKYYLFGHIGDAHIHCNMIPDNDDDFIKLKNVYTRFIKKAVLLNGTFTGEHGVGRLKRDDMKYLFNDNEITGMMGIKKIFDPKLLLNPGVMF